MDLERSSPSLPLTLGLLGAASLLPGLLEWLRFGTEGLTPTHTPWGNLPSPFLLIGGALLIASLAAALLRPAQTVERRFDD